MFPQLYFDMFREEIDESWVFVGMPFETKFQSRWDNVINPWIMDAGFTPYRVDARIINDSIIMDILKGINTAKVLLFDISKGKDGFLNGNVMYELGLAHAQRAPDAIIALRDDDDRLLFNIAPYRVKNYSSIVESDMRNEVSSLISEVVRTIDMTKEKIVEETIRLLDISSLQMVGSFIKDSKVMFNIGTVHWGSIPPEDYRPTVRRLLELGLIKYIEEDEQGLVYSLTNLGKVVRDRIKT